MKLYYSPAACSLSPHIVATEAGIPIELEKVDLASHKTESGQDYMSINPKGYVPALRLDDGSVLTEGPAIVQYLADQKPASGLAPAAGTIDRYRVQEWLTFIGTELHKSFGTLFNKAAGDDAKQLAKGNIGKRLGYLNDQLANRQFLIGEQFHSGGRLCIYYRKLDEFCRDRPQAVSECGRIHGESWSTPEGAGDTEG